MSTVLCTFLYSRWTGGPSTMGSIYYGTPAAQDESQSLDTAV